MKINPLNGNQAWAIAASRVIQDGSFRSISGITYLAKVCEDYIAYNGGNRNNGEEEIISKADFVAGYNAIRDLEEINTNTIKTLLPGSFYRKRTPFIGLLFSAEIIK